MKRGNGPVSQQSMIKCFQWVIHLETVQARTAVEYSVYRRRSEHYAQHMVLHYLYEKMTFNRPLKRAQSLSIRCQNCTDLLSNYCQFELEMCVSCTQWLLKPVAGLLCNIDASRRRAVSSKRLDTYTAIRILHIAPRFF